jgi:transmembrane sensor
MVRASAQTRGAPLSTRELIEAEASRWLAARDGDGGSFAEADFERWLQADIAHRVAFLRLESHWQRSDRLRDLRPLDRGLDADLLRPRPVLGYWPVAVAASLLLVMAAGFFAFARDFGWQHYETPIGGFSRIVLEDGSVVDLNTNSEIDVRLSGTQRQVRLLKGEGRFQVAHDSSRPFTVSAAGAAVRAVGTAFSVRLRESTQVDVLVSEGQVAIAAARVARSPPLSAGEAAIVLPGRVSVSRLAPQQLESRLAWTSGRLEFRGETLDEAVAEFNRYNRRQLQLGDRSLAALRVGGKFNATDPESFAAALASAFNLRVELADSDAIVLKPP